MDPLWEGDLKNNVYNSYLHDQMVVPKIYGPIFIYLGFMSYHEIHEIWYVQGNGLNSHFLMLLKEICTLLDAFYMPKYAKEV